MQFGNNKHGMRVHIGDAERKAKYYCPYCNAPLVQCRGDVKIHYFAHKKGCLCTDSWHYEPMTEWHSSFQARYPLENREISISNDLGHHRADVLINDTVVEFQHSPISVEEFQKRNDFYTACGYRVIWLFDAREAFLSKLTKCDANYYEWKYPPKMLTGFNVYGNIHVYFHLLDNATQSGGEIVRLTSFSDEGLCRFGVAPSEHYTEDEFINLTQDGFVIKEADAIEKDKLYHELYYVRKVNGETECYGCPINPDGYAPQTREYHRTTCEECFYCKDESHDSHIVKCAGRYREHLEQLVRLLEQHNNSITYIDTRGNIQTADIDPAPFPATSITKLAQQYQPKVMIVQNVFNGRKYLIKGDVVETALKYRGRIYGQYHNGRDWAQSREIYYAYNQEWIVVWFKK